MIFTGGIDYNTVMNMRLFELPPLYEHLWMAQSVQYECARLIGKWSLDPWSKKTLKPTDLIQFSWDDKYKDEVEKERKQTTKQDYDRLQALAKTFEKH